MTHKQSEWHYRIRAADAYKTAALYYLTQEDDSSYWMQLLLWAEAEWEANAVVSRYRKQTTPRQAEQQKLAGQLRIITGMIGQAKHLRFTGNGILFYPMDRVISDLRVVETSIRHLMTTISERIPK